MHPEPAEPPAAREEPVYQVFIPPLIFDAKAKVQPEVDPKMIVLVRRVRVRPTLIFQGRVEGQSITASTSAPASTSASVPRPPNPPPPTHLSLVTPHPHF